MERQFHLNRGTGRQQCRCIVPKAVYTVKKCSWGWANLSPETCWAELKRLINNKVVASCWYLHSFTHDIFLPDWCNNLLTPYQQSCWIFIIFMNNSTKFTFVMDQAQGNTNYICSHTTPTTASHVFLYSLHCTCYTVHTTEYHCNWRMELQI